MVCLGISETFVIVSKSVDTEPCPLPQLRARPHRGHGDWLCHLLRSSPRTEGGEKLLSLPPLLRLFVVSPYTCHTSFVTALAPFRQKVASEAQTTALLCPNRNSLLSQYLPRSRRSPSASESVLNANPVFLFLLYFQHLCPLMKPLDSTWSVSSFMISGAATASFRPDLRILTVLARCSVPRI